MIRSSKFQITTVLLQSNRSSVVDLCGILIQKKLLNDIELGLSVLIIGQSGYFQLYLKQRVEALLEYYDR